MIVESYEYIWKQSGNSQRLQGRATILLKMYLSWQLAIERGNFLGRREWAEWHKLVPQRGGKRESWEFVGSIIVSRGFILQSAVVDAW